MKAPRALLVPAAYFERRMVHCVAKSAVVKLVALVQHVQVVLGSR